MTAGSRALGARGETLAARWYEEHGYEILERNWRCREGEIDLILRLGTMVVFSEVKTRSSFAYGSPAEAVTVVKQRRIRRLAVMWLRDQQVSASDLRFDVVSVVGNLVTVLDGAF